MVSAFRSIFEEHGDFFAPVGSQIVRSFRHKAHANGRIAEKELFLASRAKLKRIRNIDKYATFWEFVQAVIRNSWNPPIGNLAVHWRPIYQQCSVCHTVILSDLKYILKYENLDDEEDKFINYLGWNDIIGHKARVTHYSHRKTKLEKNRNELTKLYFSTLDKVDVYKLYMKYKPDFELFDYPFRLNDWS
jgi:hypothetical protein